jgi:hydrogenase maturation protein HypF
MAEQGLAGPVLGIVLDGAGYGGDGTVFGGEVYRADRNGFTRLARLSHLPLPGGDRAAEQPWRMALALLYQGMGPDALIEALQPPSLLTIAPDKKQLIGQMMAKGLNCPLTSSCGRLFDAVSAMLGLCLVSDYEGQAAMLLEHQAYLALDQTALSVYPPTFREEDGLSLIETAPLAALVCRDLAAGVAIPVIARRFHLWLAASLGEILNGVRQQTGITDVVLSGGCMQNKLLFETLAEQVRTVGFSVHAGELAPMNDGGIALGQAFIGGHECV